MIGDRQMCLTGTDTAADSDQTIHLVALTERIRIYRAFYNAEQ